MQRKKWRIKFILLALLSLVTLLAILYLFPPSLMLSVGPMSISILVPAILSLFLFVYATGVLVTRKKVHGLLIGLFVSGILFLKLIGLANPLFITVTLALFITLELLFIYKK